MSTIFVDAEGHAGETGLLTVKNVVAAAIVLASLALAALGLYWMSDDPAPTAPLQSRPAAAAPAAEEPLIAGGTAGEPVLSAPEPTCIDGKPAREGVSPEACL